MTMFFYICDYLGVFPKEFFYDTDPRPAQTHELIDDLLGLGPEQFAGVKSIVRRLKKEKEPAGSTANRLF